MKLKLSFHNKSENNCPQSQIPPPATALPSWKLETLFAVLCPSAELLSFIQLLDKTAPILNYISTFFVTLEFGC